MATVSPTHAQQAQNAAQGTSVLIEEMFQNVTDAAYRQLWDGCQANPTLAMDVQVAADSLPLRDVRVRIVYQRVIEQARQSQVPLPELSLQTLNPERLAELSRAATLYKFFEALAGESLV